MVARHIGKIPSFSRIDSKIDDEAIPVQRIVATDACATNNHLHRSFTAIVATVQESDTARVDSNSQLVEIRIGGGDDVSFLKECSPNGAERSRDGMSILGNCTLPISTARDGYYCWRRSTFPSHTSVVAEERIRPSGYSDATVHVLDRGNSGRISEWRQAP